MIILLVVFFSVLQVVFYRSLASGWANVASSIERSTSTAFSVIIPVRNEERVIEKLLTCLEYQEYDKDKYEVIVVDDFSEDKTLQIVKALKAKFEMDLRVMSLKDPGLTGKKRALTMGVEHAKFPHVLTTDADCMMGPHWLASYAAAFGNKKFVAGPVALKGKGLFSRLQQIEFAGLVGFGAVTISKGSPSMCSGANLGFSKEAFLEVGGYEDNFGIPSGDDEFLLFNIYKMYPEEVGFLKSKASIVTTETHAQLPKFLNQRIRWTSKWKHHKNWQLKVTAVLFFMDSMIFLAAAVLMLAGKLPIYVFVSVFVLRWLISLSYIAPVERFLGYRRSVVPLFLLQIIYPFHVLFMGLNSIFGRYTWKGRRY